MKRITFNAANRTEKCIALLTEGGDNITDVINQSVQKNAYLEWEQAHGTKIVLEKPDGTRRELVWSFGIPEEDPA